jgi:hypothetical protein
MEANNASWSQRSVIPPIQVPPVPEHFETALAMLLDASDYSALDDCWQFAVELDELLRSGATLTDIRWLIVRGLAEHGKETTIPGESQRSFRPLSATSFPSGTCVVLSKVGAVALRNAHCGIRLGRRVQMPGRSDDNSCDESDTAVQSPTAHATPIWDQALRELRYGNKLIKRYRVPARNQTLILAAFQELSWPKFIDDPLPPDGEQNPKLRLASAIKSLNRNQQVSLVKFHGNGNGEQVYWTIAFDSKRSAVPTVATSCIPKH